MLDQAPLQLDREGIKEREDGERGGGGRLLEAGDYFKHFGLRRRLFEGRLLFEDCFVSESWLSMIILSHSNIQGFTQSQFSENICSEEDLRSRIFETFVAKFLAFLPLLGFSNI